MISSRSSRETLSTVGWARPSGFTWTGKATVTGVEIVRSVVFFGVNTLIELYWIHHLGAQPRHGRHGAGLLPGRRGGRDAARRAHRRPARAGPRAAIGTVAMVPALVALRLCSPPSSAPCCRIQRRPKGTLWPTRYARR